MVPIFADESWPVRLGRRPARNACAGVGDVVSAWTENRKALFRDFLWMVWSSAPVGRIPFHFQIGNYEIGENSCRGKMEVAGHAISWDLHCRSAFRVTLSNKGWIGFSRTPHSDALFSGQITLDGRSFAGILWDSECKDITADYRHRNFWTWTHAYFPRPDAGAVREHASKPWYTKCHSGWSFARRCSGMRGRSMNSGICRRAEEMQVN